MRERVILLGITGLNKNAIAQRLQRYCSARTTPLVFKFFDFESAFLDPIIRRNNLSYYAYLDVDKHRQRELWDQAWLVCSNELERHQDEHIVLSLHGVITRNVIGSRSAIHIPSIIAFRPTKIITLINDIYLHWECTERHARGVEYRGRPSLLELLDARRAEIFLGELISGQVPEKPPHYVLAVCHPLRTLFRLLFGGASLRTIYLSFPISGPRKQLLEGSEKGVQEVNDFLKEVYVFEACTPNIVLFCPLSIDELPLASLDISGPTDPSASVRFQLASRWDVTTFWPDEELITTKHDLTEIRLSPKHLADAVAMISSDVALRDYQLVRQSMALAVFNPFFDGEESRGVRNEINLARGNNRPIHIFQDPTHDTSGALQEMIGSPGSLGSDPGWQYIHPHDTLSSLFDELRR